MNLNNEEMFCNVVVRPAPDYGVTVNGIGLWPDGPKDRRGYVTATNDNMTVCFNFSTGHAEVYYHERPDGNPAHVVVYLFFSTLILGAALIAALWWWF